MMTCGTKLEKLEDHRVESSSEVSLSGRLWDVVAIFTLRHAGNDNSYLCITYPTINAVFH